MADPAANTHPVDNPIVERLADHSDMLTTIVNELAALQRRVERLERLERTRLL